MSVSIQTVEFERREAHLSELDDGAPWTVHGVALGAGDVTVGQSGIKKLWPADELQKSAETLEGRNLVVDHNNDAGGVVGQVTKAGYKENVGVIYEAELFDEDLAEKINNGLLEVSIRGKHIDVDTMEENEDGAKIVEGIKFDNLSIVPTGAAPSNTLEMGETEELSVSELAAFTEDLETAELQEIEPGMWVTDGDMRGITISAVQDGEVEVDIYEESDGKWRSTGETTMVSTDGLSEWDVDEEEEIGEMQDEESDEEEENAVTSGDNPSQDADPEHDPMGDEKSEQAEIPDEYFFESEDEAMSFIEDKDGLTGVHEMDEGWMPGADHDEFMEWWDNQSSQSKHKDEEEMAEGEMDNEEDDESDDEESESDKPVDSGEGREDVDREGDDEDGTPTYSEGDMVRWQVEPQLFGEIVHVDEKRDIVMVEIHESMNGSMKSTGFTISAGFSDLNPMQSEEDMDEMSEELAEGYDDYPEAAKENAQMALDAREETDNPNDCGTDVGWRRANQLASGESLSRDVIAKMSAFNRHRQNSEMDDDEGKADCGWMMWKAWGGDEGVDWAMDKLDSIEEENGINLSGVEELTTEGEESIVGEDISKEDIRKMSPERFVDEDEEELEGSVHEPTHSGEDDNEWNKPSLNDFTDESWEDLSDDEKSSIGGHFIFSMTGFPADNFSDMKLPVVRPDGTLSMNAVRNAKARLSQTDGLSDDQRDRVESMLNDMLGEDEEEAAYGQRSRTIDDTGQEQSVEDSGPVDMALDLINKYLRLEGKHERDSVDKMLGWLFGANDLPMETVSDFRTASNAFLDQTAGTDSFDGVTIEQFRDWLLMHGDGSRGRREQDVQERGELPPGFATPVHVLTGDDLQQMTRKSGESELDDATLQVTTMTNEEIEQKLAELNEPVAVEQSDLEELQQKADRFEEMSDTLESLKERTDILDEVDRSAVEELADSDEPVVVESARMEQLEGEAEQVKTVYAAALSDELGAFSAEELADKFSIEELREKYEEQIGDPAEELASSESAEPQSGDPSEEELEESAESEEEGSRTV